MHFLGDRFLRLLPLTVMMLLAAGCLSNAPTAAPDKAATLEVQAPSATPATGAGWSEVACRIMMIDGKEAPGSDSLKTGHHRVIVAFGSGNDEHVGDVDLLIPAAKNYRLKAERNPEMFTITLIETDTGKVAASSSALIDQTMKFKVFVGQK